MNDEAARQGRPDTNTNTTADNSSGGGLLTLTSISFERVEFTLEQNAKSRPVRVDVGSSTSWQRAVRFPTVDSSATQSTGDDDLDETIRSRAAEELVRLSAAVEALRATT